MNQTLVTKKRVLFIGGMILVGGIFVIVYMALTGNLNQVYNDIVVEFTSIFSSNKSSERNLIYILSLLGIAVYSIYYLKTQKKVNTEEKSLTNLDYQNTKEYLCALLAIGVVYLVVQGEINTMVFSALLLAGIINIVDRDLLLPAISAFFLSVYSYFAIYRFSVFVGAEYSGNNLTAELFSLIIAFILLKTKDRKKAFLRVGLIESVVIPFALLLFLANRYKNGEEIVTINVSNAMSFIIWAVIIAFAVRAIYIAVKRWRNIDSIQDVIRLGTCVTIMAFNRYDGSGVIMPADLHHPFENIIGYSQIVDFGSVPFKNYIPVSGMYSILQGAVFDWFGNGDQL